MPRIPLFDPEVMTPEQERVYRQIVDGPRARLVGPLRASLHRPDLADRWQRFGEILRYDTSLPDRLNELAILVVARRWTAQLEWSIHVRAALDAGLAPDVVDALRDGVAPVFADQDAYDVYEFARTLQETGDVADEVYHRIWRRWGTVGIVELSSVVGYYTLVAMTLNVHRIPLPGGEAPPLPTVDGPPGLLTLPEAELAAGAPRAAARTAG
ncbi:carboxymuconolactone decarboxylase [Amycolatopsis mediterranei S699]|uniref:Carboxymuconolactone decarboxylase n=2 Tax=Amycolatopsis mediterranei TaxID=33910 RepID=A0A0H3DH76_AMYMU|nr:carboxymuconolactone decarboxylase family protein [Amycolatopsis mediterranei]ADJ48989.1 carboxymuconolactone decarboxylase [Amycolatopsis mediterranei U32]AEK45939.1 carboxymuconolactone decarboxylase [Amycolatopsis mediterranei S699]AFO80697.1 carboxymuconolactone decarboxylase [Amycolatopsis mediterranei S699]AGT87825.1 carboxymuconolactone decarboxylase [Amycolatopsis mediterranei RB]KDU93893.1 carboxymuconolactone decarboxylase [Amycolatopsis mediterranei]